MRTRGAQSGEPVIGTCTNDVTLSVDGTAVIKRYRSVLRREHEREWTTLRLLQAHAPDLAPEPLWRAFESGPPTLAMTRLPGRPLTEPVTESRLPGILRALERLHRSVPHARLRELPAYQHGPVLRRTWETFQAHPVAGFEASLRQTVQAAALWLDSAEAQALTRTPGIEILGRNDHNLANFLADGDTVRLVDFEDAGRINRTSEYAQLVEHISARVTADSVWDALLAQLDLTAAEGSRLRAERRLLAAFWFSMLIPGQPAASRNPPKTLDSQARRLQTLLD